MTDFIPFPKVPRLSREMVITEKLDGTNASVTITPWGDDPVTGTWSTRSHRTVATLDPQDAAADPRQLCVRAGSRNRFITPDDDNFGFAAWVRDNAEELVKLGPGTHYGEWWGRGIQRGYGLDEKRFSLFNVGRWNDLRGTNGEPLFPEALPPSCCHAVPVLYRGMFDGVDLTTLSNTPGTLIDITMENLQEIGSLAAPGFMNPEGIMIYHTAARQYFKKTFEGDDYGKDA